MDISAALTPTEVALLSEPERPCEDATKQLDKHQAADGNQGEGDRDAAELLPAAFEESLRVKNTLDAFEELAWSKPSWQILSVLVNCEYRLYALNQNTRLRNNPFLSHWVEAIQRLEKPATESIAQTGSGDGIKSSHVNTVRVEFIKALLETRNPSQFASKSPKQLYANFIEHLPSPTRDFNLRTYIRMLEEEDIYERTPEPASPPPPKPPNPHQWKQDILSKLQTDPSCAIQDLTHLPIELSSLDFLTTLLQEKTLIALNIDPAPIISDYIQHTLRLVEKMGQPPPIHSSGASSTLVDSSLEGGGDGNTNILEHGKEAQTRAVKLLLLFMRNLIRKELVQVEAIYFEIQEICVRFVWIREVREFRAFIEGGGAFG